MKKALRPLAVILLLFGAAKLPALAKSVGQSARVFKGEMKQMKADDAPVATASAPTTPAAAAPAPPVVDTTAPTQAAANPGGTAEHKP